MSIIFNKYKKFLNTKRSKAIELLEYGSCTMDYGQRVFMTSGCRDTDYIPKVKDAGSITNSGSGVQVQIMHNGLKVKNGGYFGSWMSEIISNLSGHHEPQEEKIFYEVLRKIQSPGSMIELGAFWSYYSMWYKLKFPKSYVIACEPDPINIELGKYNAKLNNLDIEFIQSAAGSKNNKNISFIPDSSDYDRAVKTKIRSVDSIVEEYKILSLSILHIDVQGSELGVLEGAIKTITGGILRFIFVSTHHYSISGDVSTHIKCKNWILTHGGHIVSEHNVNESFSGDGLIVASFKEIDKNFSISTSINSSDKSLFRSYERDLATIAEAYDNLKK